MCVCVCARARTRVFACVISMLLFTLTYRTSTVQGIHIKVKSALPRPVVGKTFVATAPFTLQSVQIYLPMPWF